MRIQTAVIMLLAALAGRTWSADGWTLDQNYYYSISTGSRSYPAFADLDNDGDNDLVLGGYDGNVRYYRNDGSAAVPLYVLADTALVNVAEYNYYAAPAFGDLDGDGDLDLYVGRSDGRILYFRNDGTVSAPSFTLADNYTGSIDVGGYSTPALMDLDGDGDLDMLIGEDDGMLRHYRNDGSLLSPVWTQVSTYYETIDVGSYAAPAFTDIDNDGDRDLFIGSNDGTIDYYRNDGTAAAPAWTFIDASFFMIDAGSYAAPAFCDHDGDGDPDLFVGESGGTIAFYRNEGGAGAPYLSSVTLRFNALKPLGTNSAPVLADLDGDAKNDLLVGSGTGTIGWYRNTGTAGEPVWTLVSDSMISYGVSSNLVPAAGDLDNDGDIDLLVGATDGRIRYYRNDGNAAAPIWTLADSFYNSISTSNYAAPFLVDDDDDGDLDLYVGTYSGYVQHYRNDGNAAVPVWTTVTTMLSSIDAGYNAAPVLADLDTDGDMDLYIGNSSGTIYLYFNRGTADSAEYVLASSNYASIDIGSNSMPLFTDLDGDGDADLLIGRSDGYFSSWRNEGGGTSVYWAQETQSFNGIDLGYQSAPAFCDIDNDGDADMFCGHSGGTISFYRTVNPDSAVPCTLVTAAYAQVNVSSYSAPVFGDIDGDGDYDLFVGGYGGNVAFYRNTGTAAQAAWQLVDDMYFNIDVGSYAIPDLADIDNDGDLDLFVGESAGKIYYYRNQGSAMGPYFVQGSTYYGSIDVGYDAAPRFFDYDGDGDLDLLVGEDYGNLNLYENTGNADTADFVYSNSSYLGIDVGSNAVPVVSDFDDDGYIDLFVGAYTGAVWHWEALNIVSGIITAPAAQPGNLGRLLVSYDPAGRVTLEVTLQAPAAVNAGLYTVTGIPAGELRTHRLAAGRHTLAVELRNGYRQGGTGMYLLRISAESFERVQPVFIRH